MYVCVHLYPPLKEASHLMLSVSVFMYAAAVTEVIHLVKSLRYLKIRTLIQSKAIVRRT